MSTFTDRYNDWWDDRLSIGVSRGEDPYRWVVSDEAALGLLAEAAAIIASMARLFTDSTVFTDLAESFTCDEADTIATFIAATIGQEQSGEFLLLHAKGDTPADSHFDLKENTDA